MIDNADLSADQVESAAVTRLVTLSRQFLDLQEYLQPAPKDQAWLRACINACTEMTVTVTITKGGIASVRLATVDGAGNEEALRIIEAFAARPN